MKIKIKEQELELHYSLRIYMFYENIMGHSIDMQTISSYTSLVVLFYSAILATLQYEHKNLDITYDEYMDWLDSQHNILADFASWFIKNVEVSAKVTPIKDSSDESTDTLAKKKSKSKKDKDF